MISKQAYVQHVPGHKNSKGEAAPYVVKQHDTGKILSSHKTEAEAKAHLKQMEIHKHMNTSLSLTAKLDVEKASKEVEEKTTIQINEETAYTWGSRAAACFQKAEESKDEKEKDKWTVRAEDFLHEALEHAALVQDSGKLVGEIQNLVKASPKKEANTIPYNGNRPQDKEVDPGEKEEGYGGDREGVFYSPKGSQMKATTNQDLGTIKKGDLVVITGSKDNKLFFYAEQDPSLVGIGNKNLFTPYSHKKAVAVGFLKCHGILSKSSVFITKLASELGSLVEPSVLDRLEEIKNTVSTNRDRVMNELPVSPVINANLRLADAALYFTIKGVVPTEKDTIQYIRASMAAHTSLPEDTWSDEIVKSAMLNRKTTASYEWSDKLLLMQQWHLAGTLSQSIWNELLTLLDSDNLEDIRTGIEILFNKASETVKKPETRTAAVLPPKPTDIPPAGLKYAPVYEPGQDPVWALVAMSSLHPKKEVTSLKKK